MTHTVKDIAELIQGELIGDSSIVISNVAKIEDATSSDLCFISNKKYNHYLNDTKAGAVIVGNDIDNIQSGVTVIKCSIPYVAFCKVLIEFFDYKDPNIGVHPKAIVSETATIGENVYVGPGAYIGDQVVIGNDSKIYANACIYENCSIGTNSRIYANNY